MQSVTVHCLFCPYSIYRPHHMHTVHRCGLLLQMSQVAWSVCLCWSHGRAVPKCRYQSRCHLTAYFCGPKEPCINLPMRRGNFLWLSSPLKALSLCCGVSSKRNNESSIMEWQQDCYSCCHITLLRKVKASHTRYRALGPELIPVYRQSASTYLKNSRKVKASAENVHLWYKHKLADVHATHWGELHQWLSMSHDNHPLLQFVDIMDHLLSTAALFSRFYSHRIQTWSIKTALYLARWILRSHVQYVNNRQQLWFSSFTRYCRNILKVRWTILITWLYKICSGI